MQKIITSSRAIFTEKHISRLISSDVHPQQFIERHLAARINQSLYPHRSQKDKRDRMQKTIRPRMNEGNRLNDSNCMHLFLTKLMKCERFTEHDPSLPLFSMEQRGENNEKPS